MDEKLSVVGTSPPMKGSGERVKGTAVYTVDLQPPGMLHAKMLRSIHAHARIRGIDTSRAEALPGVKAVITHREAKILYKPTHGSAREYGLDDRVRYYGDKVAAVAAVSEEVAEEALVLIDVEYEVLPAVFDMEEALKHGAPVIHPEREDVDGNVLDFSVQEWGDVEEGFLEADNVFENRYTTSRVCHCAMEPHAMLASWDGDGNLTMWSSEQTAFMIRDSLSEALGIPRSKIRFIVPPHVGGGFGGKYESAEKIVVALLARKAGRPVMLRLSREEVFHTTRTRSPCVFETKTGVKRDGTLVARQVKAVVDIGSYAWGGIMASRAASYMTLLYRCPNIKYVGHGVYTNTPPSGAMRGFTSTPIHFAMESEIDEIACAIGMDPKEFRLKNQLHVGDIIPLNGKPVTSSGLREAVLKGGDAIGWERRQKTPGAEGGTIKRGIGMACYSHYAPMLKDTERSVGNAVLKVNIDGSFHLLLGVPDIGQGLRTVMAQIAAEALGGRLDKISVTLADTSTTPWGTTTAASRSTMETGGAVKTAAEQMKGRLLELASGIMNVPVEDLDAKEGIISAKGVPEQKLTFGDVLRHPDVFHGGDNVIVKEATYNVPTFVPPYGTAFAEVEVDTETGMVRVLKIVAASDIGRAIHPRSVEGQLEGGMQMGIGYALTEELKLHPETGEPLNNSFLDYKVLRAAEMPEMEVILVEPVEPNTVYGVKGIGEMAVIPIAPAVRNAVYNATGAAMRELPITSEKILRALRG
ncbi:MAG: molybdopterin-dependent oxidoreductase [Candidatus Bathyarchaeota archaeon]|nr:MAG: molybdopterin-dependent oxidoreductase [Candidatus Bathyarchaeota archaeon]